VKLTTRMWLSGALAPALVMAVSSAVAGQIFRAALESSLDRALLAQGAAESVSLFDRTDGPHLHMAESPLLAEVAAFAPTGELFSSSGALMAHFPPTVHPAAPVSPPLEGPASELRTTGEGDARRRELLVRVLHPSGEHYVLRLSASLAQLDGSVRTFHVTALFVVLAVGLLLAAFQAISGRRLSARIALLSQHLARLRHGQLDTPPAHDDGDDEIAQLRAVLADTTEQLKQARAVQDRLLADAAHELRTPLTLMRTTLDLALRKQRSADELREALQDARAEVDRLARLASALLDVAAAGRGWDLTSQPLEPLVQDSAEAARAEAEERGVLLELDVAPGARAKVHAAAFRQALDNLVGNALRYAPRGTTITLSVRPHGDNWRLDVRDRGPGIPPHALEAVFAPFHREDATAATGSGLGLAIAAEVMRQHRGRAFATTPTDGPGALVSLELPRDADDPPSAAGTNVR